MTENSDESRIPASAGAQSSLKSRWSKVDAVLLSAVGLAFCTVYGTAWYIAATCPIALEYEGTMFWAANTLAHGGNIYDAVRLVSSPWQVITYPPVFLILSAVMMKLLGSSWICLRAVTIAATLASVWLFYRILRLSGCSPLEAAIGPAFAFGFSPCFVFGCIGRPDMLALAFSLAGLERLYYAWLCDRRNCPVEAIASVAQPPRLSKEQLLNGILSALYFALACYTKQTSIVAFVSGILFLFWCRSYKLLSTTFLAFGGFCSVALVVAQLSTGGFLQNITIFSKTPWSADILLRYLHFMNDGDDWRIKIMLIVILLYFMIWRKQETTVQERLPYVFFHLSLLWMLYIMGLPGSNANHAIMPLLSMSWWLAVKCKTLIDKESEPGATKFKELFPSILKRVVLVSSMIGLFFPSSTSFPALAFYLTSQLNTLPGHDDNILKDFPLQGKLVLSEDPYLNCLSASNPGMIDCAVFTSVWKRQPERMQELKHMFENQSYAAVIMNAQDADGKGQYFWPADIAEAIRSRYKPVAELPGNGIPQKLMLPAP